MFPLKDDSFEFSKTQLKTELIDKKIQTTTILN